VTISLFEEYCPTILHAKFQVAYARVACTRHLLFQLLTQFIKVSREKFLLMKRLNK
jgi:hypothetical protein